MTSPISGLSAVGSALSTTGVPSTSPLDPASGGGGSLGVDTGSGLAGAAGVTGTDGTPSTSGADFAAILGGGVDKLQGLQSTSDTMAVQAATGSATDIHKYMIASNEAALATQMTVAVRNKALEAFTQIMQMQA